MFRFIKIIIILSIIFLGRINIISQTYNWEYIGLENISAVLPMKNGKIVIGKSMPPNLVQLSTDNGVTWTPIFDCSIIGHIKSDDTDKIYVTSENGITISSDFGTTWDTCAAELPTTEYNDIIIKPNGDFVISTWLGVYVSEDDGESWIASNFDGWGIIEMGLSPNGYLYGANPTASYFGIYTSSDGGYNWVLPAWISSICVDFVENDPIIGTEGWLFPGMITSNDNGFTWEQFCDFWGEDEPVKEILVTSVGWIFASGNNDNGSGIYLSEDNGTTWKKVFDERANAIAEDENGFIYLGCPSGLYRILYSDLPVELVSFSALVEENSVTLNWITATETNSSGFEVQRLQYSKIERLQNWETIGFVEGKGTTTEANNYCFIDIELQSGTYKYRLKQIDFDGSFEHSQEIDVEIKAPLEFTLKQNYPNPFNPSTTISYQLPESGKVNLVVYDILGKEIVSLVNEYKTSGNYDVEFNTSTLPSGVYIYSLRLNDYSSVKKMTAVK